MIQHTKGIQVIVRKGYFLVKEHHSHALTARELRPFLKEHDVSIKTVNDLLEYGRKNKNVVIVI